MGVTRKCGYQLPKKKASHASAGRKLPTRSAKNSVNGQGSLAFPTSPATTENQAMTKATARTPRGMTSSH